MWTVAQAAKAWGVSERSVRGYCAQGRVPGAELIGKTWAIPEGAEKPSRKPRVSTRPVGLLEALRREKASGISGGIYHHVQIELTYNSNHIEGSRLTHEQTRHIFETNTLGIAERVNVDDIVETAHHFRCIDMVIDAAERRLSERMIKQLHLQLKSGTSDSRKSWFRTGEYKLLPNEVGGRETVAPEEVSARMRELIDSYERSDAPKSLEDIVAFHVAFERIHPFQDGNGRVGRLVMFKECLRHRVVPFIITDEIKLFYYRGLSAWDREPGYLLDTCLAAQDAFNELMRRFRIE
ncbi:Fic family protein [Collinsella sp. An2]|uniref:Fic family protein n=1 Tax=Collinsella sp. An2 TaxID=1965585 RepID=UPI000B3AD419|nr:Fic family protein [Collinsella sp. An2]OUP08408.1 cell filamentation protein Fic [Collinsella sp. An2]